MASVKNISTGPRGAYLKGQLVMAEVGAVIEADDFADEWFEEVDDDDDASELAKMKVPELKALAEAENIDIGDATKKSDIIAAIELAREEAANA